MRKTHLIAAVAAALVLGGCGSSGRGDTTASSASPASTASDAEAPAGARNCAINADGKIRKMNLKSDRGLISARNLGDNVRFKPSRDIARGTLKEGTAVFFTYVKTAKGPAATCITEAKPPKPPTPTTGGG